MRSESSQPAPKLVPKDQDNPERNTLGVVGKVVGSPDKLFPKCASIIDKMGRRITGATQSE